MEFLAFLFGGGVAGLMVWLVKDSKLRSAEDARREAEGKAEAAEKRAREETTARREAEKQARASEKRAREETTARREAEKQARASEKRAREGEAARKRQARREQTPEDVRVMAELQKENTEEAQRKEDFRKLNVSEGRQGKPIKPASPNSTEPKLDPSLLRKLDTSEGYSKLGGRDSAWN